MYLLRLDDASEYMDIEKWNRMENLLKQYNITPIVGVIPNNEDENIVHKYVLDENFWKKVRNWQKDKWSIAMHGYNHKYITKQGGINPINHKSEFAGLTLQEQKQKIRDGVEKMKKHNIEPTIFFAPSHTFDVNTLIAIKEESNIRIISDTIANDIYKENDIFFIPQQAGRVRKLPFKLVTFCYHPNTMTNEQFLELEKFLRKYQQKFGTLQTIRWKPRRRNLYDKLLEKIYFILK